MLPIKQRVQEAAKEVQKRWRTADAQADCLPEIIITTGSGLGALVNTIVPGSFEMSYNGIPHLPATQVDGHAGRLVIGHFGSPRGKKVVMLDGRVHGYEGHDPLTQVLPLLIANELCGGAKLAIFTNAAGAINEDYAVGELMLIMDHINFTGDSLLTFNEESDFGGENLDMTFTYTPEYRRIIREIASKAEDPAGSPRDTQVGMSTKLHEGVYVGFRGAMFETPAEIRAMRSWGADAVGMSTIHEVVAASRLEIDVVGISVIANMAAGIEAKKLTHQEVLDNTASAADELSWLISSLLDKHSALFAK